MTTEGSISPAASSPLASIDDIRKRLLRPSSSSVFSPEDGVGGSNSSQIKVNLSLFKRKQVSKNKEKKLEDYLDPFLLSSISAQIGPQAVVRKERLGMKSIGRDVKDQFDWPVDELKVFMAAEASKAEKKEEAVLDLGNDAAVNVETGDGVGEFCAPF